MIQQDSTVQSETFRDTRYQWSSNDYQGVINGMEIFKGKQINLVDQSEKEIIIVIYFLQQKICSKDDQNFINKLNLIPQAQQIADIQVIKVRKTLIVNKILQINDYYDYTLAEYLKRTDQPREIILQQLKDIAAILALMHANNYIHGNINKQTIVLKNNKFHLAHFENFQYANSVNDQNYARGEQTYINPQGNQLSVESDVYQLGVVFFMIYTLEQEFKHELLQKYNVNPYTILIQNMTTDINDRCNIRMVFNQLENIIAGSHELQWIDYFKQFTNHLLAWEFLLDTINLFENVNLIKQDEGQAKYLSILFETILHHRQKTETYNQKLISEEHVNQSRIQSQKKVKQYQQLIIDTTKKIEKLNILVPVLMQRESQNRYKENQKAYIIKTLQLSNNVHDLHQKQADKLDVDQLKLCIRLFFCVDLENLHINIKERSSQYQDIQSLGYNDCMRALEQQLSHYFKKLSDYF